MIIWWTIFTLLIALVLAKLFWWRVFSQIHARIEQRQPVEMTDLLRQLNSSGDDDVAIILSSLGEYFRVDPRKLRPTDRFSSEFVAPIFGPGYLLDLAIGHVMHRLRTRYPRFPRQLGLAVGVSLDSVSDLVIAFKQEIERSRMLT